MSFTLAQLLAPEAKETIRARLASTLTGKGIPVADWAPSSAGGVENLWLDMVSAALAELMSERIASVSAGRFLEFAERDWLTYLAAKLYQTERRAATKTIQNVRITAHENAPPYNFEALDIVVRGDSGNEYRSLDAFSVEPGKWADVRFQAEGAGKSYDDVAGTITSMVTAPAGLDCENLRPSDFTDAKGLGYSSGKVSAAFTIPDTPPTFGSIRVRITASGDLGSARFDYSLDGGATWTPGGIVGSEYAIPGGATLFFENATSPSFVIGDVITLLVGDAILQRGTDDESDEALRGRCRLRWLTLSDVPLGGAVELWAKAASDEVHKVIADANPNTPGSILCTIASESGPASPAAVIAVQDYVAARLKGYQRVPAPSGGSAISISPEEHVLAASARAYELTPAGTVLVARDQLAAVQLAADANWRAYLRDLPIGAPVIYQELVQAIMDADAIDVADLTLNGGTTNIALGEQDVAVPATGTSLVTSLKWKPV